MAVLIRHRVAGIDPGRYDEISPPLVEELKKQPGFVFHVAYEGPEGFTVAEVWESQEQHDEWFDNNVQPKLPAKAAQEVIPLHSVHKP